MLGLKTDSDSAWVSQAMADLDRVLVDHAHCEMKAASNALSLAARHPHDLALVRALTEIAREEIEHFQRVLELLVARGLALGPPPVDPYAAELRRAAGDPRAPRSPLPPLADRLVVGALIEARSCERFKLLATALGAAGDRELCAFYTELLASEARHFRTFVDLAVAAAVAGVSSATADPALRAAGAGGARALVLARLDALAEREGEIVRALSRPAEGRDRAAIHG
jgi:tRNA-(ms[2]io[6]A)-hydroxylase